MLGGLALLLAGCGSAVHQAATTTTTTSPTTAAPTTSAPSPSTAAPTSAPSLSACRSSDLQVSLTAPLGSAGAFHYQLVLRNASSSKCTLYGFPGVSFLDTRGTQIGPPAEEGTTAPRQLVTLAPGGSGFARLDVTDPGIPPCAGPGTVARVRIYPPGSYTSITAAPPPGMVVCTSSNTATYTASTVGPVTAASSPGYNP